MGLVAEYHVTNRGLPLVQVAAAVPELTLGVRSSSVTGPGPCRRVSPTAGS